MNFLDKIQSLFQSKELDVSKRFEILREAVTGTMSQFHVARDVNTGQIVGLKLLDREKTLAFEARFKGLKKPTEGEIATSIKYPLIVETLEHGLTTTGQQYLVMEYVKGSNLHLLINNRDPVLHGRLVKIIKQMAESLQVVHKAGFIHRDICPRNFIFDPETDVLKMIDFGLTVPALKEFMQPGNRTGTPQYMASEVVRRRTTDQRLDIFSFGVSCFQLCALELPWPSTEATGKVALAHDTMPPRELLELCPKLNHKLAALIMKCIKPTPEARPPDVTAILRELRKIDRDDEPDAT